jgi:hypothetical protein
LKLELVHGEMKVKWHEYGLLSNLHSGSLSATVTAGIVQLRAIKEPASVCFCIL